MMTPALLFTTLCPTSKIPHDDIPCVRHNENGTEGLENPLEEHPGIYIVQIVFLCHKLDQLITHYECQDNPGDWNDHRFREVSDHRKDAAVPCQRRLAHFTGDLATLVLTVSNMPDRFP